MKTRNIKLALTAILTVGLLSVFAIKPAMLQGAGNGDRIEALRIAYISEQLNLTPDEAQKFWPVYNAYKSDLKAVMQKYPVGSQLTADQQLALEQQKLDLKVKYKPQFESALGTLKLNQLYNLEHKFQEKLKEIREQRMQQKGSLNTRPGGQR